MVDFLSSWLRHGSVVGFIKHGGSMRTGSNNSMGVWFKKKRKNVMATLSSVHISKI